MGKPRLLEQTATLFQLIQVRDPVGRVVARHYFDFPVAAVNHEAHHKVQDPRSGAETLCDEKALCRKLYGEGFFRQTGRASMAERSGGVEMFNFEF